MTAVVNAVITGLPSPLTEIDTGALGRTNSSLRRVATLTALRNVRPISGRSATS